MDSFLSEYKVLIVIVAFVIGQYLFSRRDGPGGGGDG